MRKILAALICAMLLLSAGAAGSRGVLTLLGVGYGASSGGSGCSSGLSTSLCLSTGMTL
jgi:hypothetical protein